MQDFHAVIGPLVAELNTIFSDSSYAADVKVDDLTWMESLEVLCEGKPMLNLPGEYDEHDTFVRLFTPASPIMRTDPVHHSSPSHSSSRLQTL